MDELDKLRKEYLKDYNKKYYYNNKEAIQLHKKEKRNRVRKIVLNDISEITDIIVKIKNVAICSNNDALITVFVLGNAEEYVNEGKPKKLILKQYRLKGERKK